MKPMGVANFGGRLGWGGGKPHCSMGVNYHIRSIIHYSVSLCVWVSLSVLWHVLSAHKHEHQTLPVSIFFPWEWQIKRIESVMD